MPDLAMIKLDSMLSPKHDRSSASQTQPRMGSIVCLAQACWVWHWLDPITNGFDSVSNPGVLES